MSCTWIMKLRTIRGGAGFTILVAEVLMARLIAERLTAADPANAQWQRDLKVARQRLDELKEQ